MPFTLDQIVPWGRTFDEYRRMFALSDADLSRRILGCGDGPASFNAEATARGASVVSVDPIYAFGREALARRFEEVREEVLRQAELNRAEFVWETFKSIAELGAERGRAMSGFLADFEAGKRAGRYVVGELPQLPLAADACDLALVSHLLFLYSRQLDLDFHRRAIAELLRVAREVRIFPLLQLGATPSPHVEPLVAELGRSHRVEIVPVDYEFQRGGNRMLRIVRADSVAACGPKRD
jgi:SAM-dependent methyltransferase